VLCLTLSAGAVAQSRTVIPMGQTVGIKLFSQGVLVVGFSEIPTDSGDRSPAKACGLKEGDVITHMGGTPVNSIEEVQTVLQALEGDTIQLRYLRKEKEETANIRAVKCSTDGTYKLGAWIRDSMAGIGTMTFVDPETGLFGTLGHGINDVDTSVLMHLDSGSVTPAAVAGVVKGMDGRPGELQGRFAAQEEVGKLYANTTGGVFGFFSAPSVLTGTPVEVAQPEQVHTGAATILSTVTGSEPEEYAVEIIRVYDDARDTRDLMLKVTDPRLLKKTGGIVQGMSGSPILQDGRLVGAVTHVLIDHADRGYGILATHMLQAAET